MPPLGPAARINPDTGQAEMSNQPGAGSWAPGNQYDQPSWWSTNSPQPQQEIFPALKTDWQQRAAGGIGARTLDGGGGVLQNPGTMGAYGAPMQAQGPQQGGQVGLPQLTSGMSRDQVRQAITDYYAARGAAPQGNSIDYWTDKYFEFGDKDPEYYNRFLSNAEEFTGGRAGTAKGMFGIDLPAGGGAAGGYGGMDPGFQFRLGEGLKGIERSAAARGTLLTGGTMKGLQRYAQDYASGEFGNTFNRNLALANLGAQAAGGMGAFGAQYGTSATNLHTGMGDVQASGTVGGANPWIGTLGQLGNIGSFWAANRPQTTTPGGTWGTSGTGNPNVMNYNGPLYGPGY